ncbi:hypothetical protein LLB_0672 [Legionella longbeachae D-4968]|nr:hypothetical protein LLB_0672 [Legionella longbeachae D-4968]
MAFIIELVEKLPIIGIELKHLNEGFIGFKTISIKHQG